VIPCHDECAFVWQKLMKQANRPQEPAEWHRWHVAHRLSCSFRLPLSNTNAWHGTCKALPHCSVWSGKKKRIHPEQSTRARSVHCPRHAATRWRRGMPPLAACTHGPGALLPHTFPLYLKTSTQGLSANAARPVALSCAAGRPDGREPSSRRQAPWSARRDHCRC